MLWNLPLPSLCIKANMFNDMTEWYFFSWFLLWLIKLNQWPLNFGFSCCSLCALMPSLLTIVPTHSEYIIIFLLESLYCSRIYVCSHTLINLLSQHIPEVDGCYHAHFVDKWRGTVKLSQFAISQFAIQRISIVLEEDPHIRSWKASYINNIFTELRYRSLLFRSQLCFSEDTSHHNHRGKNREFHPALLGTLGSVLRHFSFKARSW